MIDYPEVALRLKQNDLEAASMTGQLSDILAGKSEPSSTKKEFIARFIRLEYSTIAYKALLGIKQDGHTITDRRSWRETMAGIAMSLCDRSHGLADSLKSWEYTVMQESVSFMHDLLNGRIIPFDDAKEYGEYIQEVAS